MGSPVGELANNCRTVHRVDGGADGDAGEVVADDPDSRPQKFQIAALAGWQRRNAALAG